MLRRDADRNLLFGINALQNDFITRDDLIAAMNAWAFEKHRPLGDILVERNALNPDDRDLLNQLIDRHLARHGGDPAASLAAMSSVGSIAHDLRKKVADPDVLESVAHIPTDSQAARPATRAPETADFSPAGVRYRKVRDHAKGGLGVVFIARDNELNREVALKEIKPEYADNLGSQARFLIEAEITGGLEHPGIVPVYGLGHYDDGRPYYAMRFIRGDSLKEAISTFHGDKSLKDDPGARALSLQKLLRRFLDVCNAVAYAHSRGVLHRDLKPDNVMIGRYGETLVVDWGLAKSVGRSGEDGYGPLPESTVLYPTKSNSAETIPGSIVGTPGYMSPEQAAGRLDLLGPASDVYSLGCTLYTILTGRVPITGKDVSEILVKIERGEFPPPRAVSPWVDPALDAICHKAMALKPGARYPSPSALSDDIERFLADEPATAYRESSIRKVSRWGRKHRATVMATASTMLVTAVLIGSITFEILDRKRRADVAGLATLTRAEVLAAEARKTLDPYRWREAIAEARRAEAQLEAGGGSDGMKSKAFSKIAEFKLALDAEVRDRKMVTDLDEARLSGTDYRNGNYNYHLRIDAILSAFRSYGIDLTTLPDEEIASRIRTSQISGNLISALDEALSFPVEQIEKTFRVKILHVINLADSNPIGAEIRELVARSDLEGLRRIVIDADPGQKLGVRYKFSFITLATKDPRASIPILESLYKDNRTDFWLTMHLAMACQMSEPPQTESAIRYCYAAAALRPDSPGIFVYLGYFLDSNDELDAAILAYREAIRLNPEFPIALTNLASSLFKKEDFENAMTACLNSIRIKPEIALSHDILGDLFAHAQDFDGAIRAYKEAIRLDPDFIEAHLDLGNLLSSTRRFEEAIKAFGEAVRLNPDDPDNHMKLGESLVATKDFEKAISEYREAIRLEPESAEAQGKLGDVLRTMGDFNGAVGPYREAIRLEPEVPDRCVQLGDVLLSLRDIDGAITTYREAIRLNSALEEAHFKLGYALRTRSDFEAAITEFREAILLNPNDASAHFYLGYLLKTKGQFVEALKHLERASELGSMVVNWNRALVEWYLEECRRSIVLGARFSAILKDDTGHIEPRDRLVVAKIAYDKALHGAAARFFGQAFADDPLFAEDLVIGHRYNAACAAALAGLGMGEDQVNMDDATRTRFLRQALGWLRADLASREKLLGGDAAKSRRALVAVLNHWRTDRDLAGVRDEKALAKLPEGEREAFRSLWADVETLRKKAESGVPTPPKE